MDEIDDAIALALHKEADFPYSPSGPVSEMAKEIAPRFRAALCEAGYEIVHKASAQTHLMMSQFNQPRQSISRAKAELILQEIYGPINGIERMSDGALEAHIPNQFKIAE